jgi:hypothetical protein
MSKTLAFLKKEFMEMLPPTIFFFIVFEIIVSVRLLIGAQTNGFTMTTSATAVISALILGKSILIADALPLFKWFRDRRLIYNVLWRIVLYLSVVLLFQVFEELIPLIRKYDSVAAAFVHLMDEIHWSRFAATHIVLAVFLMFYCVFTAMISVIGHNRFVEAFFGRSKPRAE